MDETITEYPLPIEETDHSSRRLRILWRGHGLHQTDRPPRGAALPVSSIPGAFSLLYVPGKLIVEGDAAATAERLRTSEGLLRAGIAADLFSSIVFIFLALVLYRLFKPVAAWPALAMMVLILLSFPLTFLGIVNEVSALNFAGGGDARSCRPSTRTLATRSPTRLCASATSRSW